MEKSYGAAVEGKGIEEDKDGKDKTVGFYSCGEASRDADVYSWMDSTARIGWLRERKKSMCFFCQNTCVLYSISAFLYNLA